MSGKRGLISGSIFQIVFENTNIFIFTVQKEG